METARVSKPVAVVALTFLAALSRAQDSTPLVRSNSRLVLLDVIVTGKAGHPIPGLTQEDFTVFENGVAQKILSFESPSGDSNGATRPANSSQTIILLDQLNIAFADLAYARNRIVLFLEQNLIEHQPTSLMEVGLHGLTMVQDFTRDSKRLEDQLTHLAAVTANPADGYMDPRKSQEHAQEALGALTQIARAAVGSPCSLNVIWVTSGFSGLLQASNSGDKVEAGLRSVANLLIRSRMRLYTIDPSGVHPISAIAGPGRTSRGNALAAHESSAEQVLGSSGGQQFEADVMLGRLTGMMGGLSYYRRNDVEQALSQAILDGSSAYALSYSPSNSDFNGEYRKIEVRTNIDGASARTRHGYYAVPGEPIPDAGMRDARLKTALASPLSYAGLNLTCPLTYDPSKGRLAGNLTIAPRPLVSEADQTGQIIRAASFSEDGKLLNSWSWQVNWKSPWTNRVVTAYFDKVLPRNARRVRFLVSDPAADRIDTCEYRMQ